MLFFGRVKDATHGVVAVGELPLGFQVKLGLVRGKYLPAGLYAVEASYVSASSHSAFRAAIVRSVWSSKMSLANTNGCSQTCWMVRLVQTWLSTLSGLGVVLCVSIWPTVRWKLLAFFRTSMGPLDMGLCTCFLFLLRKYGFSGMESNKVGFVLLFLPLGFFGGNPTFSERYFRGLAAHSWCTVGGQEGVWVSSVSGCSRIFTTT